MLLGLRCCSSPIIAYDGTEATWTISRDYVPCASPGSLAPHAWLPDGGSLYDLFGDGYTLLVLDNFDAPDIQRARAEAERVGVRLRSAEHTAELQSLMPNSYAVFFLKTKNTTNKTYK